MLREALVRWRCAQQLIAQVGILLTGGPGGGPGGGPPPGSAPVNAPNFASAAILFPALEHSTFMTSQSF